MAKHVDYVLDYASILLPGIPHDAVLSAFTKVTLENRGKVPGVKNGDGSWTGLPNWPRLPPATLLDAVRWDGMGAVLGFRLGIDGYFLVDADLDTSAASAAALAIILQHAGEGAAIRRVDHPEHFRFSYLGRVSDGPAPKYRRFACDGGHIEFKGSGAYSAIHGVHNRRLRPYVWDNDPLDVPVGTITLAQLQALMQALSLALHGEAAPIAGKATRSDNALYHPPMQCSIEQLDRVLAILPNDTVFFEPYERFEAMGFGIAGATGKSAAGRQRWIDWCGQVFQEQENKPEDFWASIENPRFGYPRLLKLAFERAPEEALALVQEESRFAFADDLDQATIATGAEAAEEAARVQDDLVAEAFAASVAGGMRYVAVSGKWLEWRSAHWVEDAILRVNSLARRTCRRERVKRTSMATMVNKVLALAKADPRLAATADQWDRNDWLLNTPGGSVDLKTGVMRPHDREDYCTKMTAVTPQGDCPLFKAFLRRILNDDAELIAFVKRTIGYCLTGDTSEQVILFNHGLGQNGKTVLMSTIAGMLGSYCLSASIETFTESRSDRHPTELARLQGARLVIATETEANRYWAESRLKELTGGERITARYMHKDFFTFQPKFKPWISGNHRPRLHSIGQAMRRRVFLIPFEVTIPDKDRDFGLTEKLKAEWPGILAWAIEGCLEFQAVGLQPARAVVQATDAYFSEEDAYANWLMECCEIDYSSQVQSMALFSSWSDWAEHNQRPRDSLKRFYAEMGRLGHIPTHVRTGSVFKGLRIKLSFEV